LSCPKGENAEFYYRRKLNCYNFTIFDGGKRRGYCYFLDETTPRRGSNEVASFLNDFIRNRHAEGAQEFRFYSDNCYGQNKNGTLYAMYYFLCQELEIKITHTYLEKGHTQMECDSMHAAIERKSKRMSIFTPSQWCAVIRMAKATLPHYEVNKSLAKCNIRNMKALTKLLQLKKVPTSNVRQVAFKAGSSAIFYRTKFAGQLESVKVTRRATPTTIQAMELAYTSRVPLAPLKLKDLEWLWNHGHIDRSAEPFYTDLKAWGLSLLATTSHEDDRSIFNELSESLSEDTESEEPEDE